MTTIATQTFSINGVIDTNKTVMQNMNTMAAAAGSWVTFDVNAGKWSVVINQAGSSVASFTDANIVGSIAISGTGLTEFYNKVQLEFPHKDIIDQKDTITYSIPAGDRYPNEQDNVLNFQFDCVNDPVQAELLAVRELKQSRVDKVIRFSTDFSKMGLKAGDLIDITSEQYGFTNKLFRILTISEEDSEGGAILLSITAYEYDSGVFDTTGLEREVRSATNDILSECANTAVQNSNNAAAAGQTANGLALLTPALIATLLNAITRRVNAGSPGGYSPGAVPQVYSLNAGDVTVVGNETIQYSNLGSAITLPYTGRYKLTYNLNWGVTPSTDIPLGILKLSYMIANVNGVDIPLNDTGDRFSPAYEDQLLEGFFDATAGATLLPKLGLASNYPQSYSVPAGYPTHTPPSGAVASTNVISKLEFIGAA